VAKICCCYNCAFAYLDPEHTLECYSRGMLNWPACANHPDSYGRMRRTPERGICSNYRDKPGQPQGEYKQIPLGEGFYAYVDAADYEWLSRWTWSMRGGYAVRLAKRKIVFMHREIAQPPDGMIVDHKNLNKLDNTRVNLKNCTHQENACNRSKRRGTISRFRGVGFNRGYGKHFADIFHKGKRYFLGYFPNEVEAARARDHKAIELQGESARVNFPEEWPPERRAEVRAEWERTGKDSEPVRRRGRKKAVKPNDMS
jgi:hypothetical protein